jgi:predicted RNase H-like HicB family nuclease
MLQARYEVNFRRLEDGGYIATVPALPGCLTDGDTLYEARRNVEDAIQSYLETLLEDGDHIPNAVEVEEDKPLVESITFSIPAPV